MNKTKLLPIVFLAIILTSCGAEVNEVYRQGQFESVDFLENFYETYPAILKNSPIKQTFTLDETNTGYGTMFDTNRDTAPIRYILDTDQALGYEQDLYDELHDLTEIPNVLKISNTYFTRNRLANVDKSFKYGYFSKLTDGLVHCDGSGAHVRIQIKEAGLGQIFAKEIIDYSTMLLSFRGGTNIPWGTAGYDYLPPAERSAQVRVNFSLYVAKNEGTAYDRYQFTTVRATKTDDNGTNTNLLYFNLEEVLGDDFDLIKRASAFSLNYELLEHPKLKPTSGIIEPAYADYEFALMLYEVAFPHSSWN